MKKVEYQVRINRRGWIDFDDPCENALSANEIRRDGESVYQGCEFRIVRRDIETTETVVKGPK